MTPDLTTFRALYPEFNDVTDATVTLYIESSKEVLSEQNWGRCWSKAVLLLAAHDLKLSLERQAGFSPDTPSAAGALTSASAGGLSVGFGYAEFFTRTASNSYYSKTPYGQEYLVLRRRCLPRSYISSCTKKCH